MSSALEILLPPGGSGLGAFVVHPWWGRNATVLAYGRALAERGFVVGLPDAFAGDVVTGREEAQGLLEKHWKAAPGRLTADFYAFAANPAVMGPVSGVGFSFGGFQLLGLMDALPLRRLVTYYADREVVLWTVPVLGHFAETDEFQDDQPGMIRMLEAAGPPGGAVVYPGTRHWFAEADRPEFDAAAAKAAFERTVEFLQGLAADAPSTMLRMVPLPRQSGGGARRGQRPGNSGRHRGCGAPPPLQRGRGTSRRLVEGASGHRPRQP